MSADGLWKITVNSPMGPMESDLTIRTSGNTFTGTMTGRLGTQEINGKVDGDTLSFTTSITQPMPLTLDVTATVAGDDISGVVKAGPLGSAPLKGTRA